MPFSPIAVILVVRAILWGIQSHQTPRATAPKAGGALEWRISALLAIGAFAIAALSWSSILTGLPFGLIIAVPVTVFALAWPIAAFVAIPRGWSWVAFQLGRVSTVVWRLDFRGGAVVAGARALLRQEVPSPDEIARVQAYLDGVRPLLAGSVLGAGLLADVRGDRAEARRLIESLGWFRPDRCPSIAWSMAREWLVIDAVAVGDWDRAARVGRPDGRPRSMATALLAGAAGRILGLPNAPSDSRLWAWWAMAGRWNATSALVRRAITAVPRAPQADVPSTLPEGEPLLVALDLHARAAASDAPARADVLWAVRAWERALDDPGIDRQIAERGPVLGARGLIAARARFDTEVRQEVAALAESAGVPLSAFGDNGMLGGAVRDARDKAVGEIELAAKALGRRIEERRELAAIDELREFLALADQYDRLGRTCGPLAQRVVFRRVHEPVCSLAVWLFNERGHKPLGNALFRWLLDVSKAAGDTSCIELQTKNCACGF